jgi:hypothetical protein
MNDYSAKDIKILSGQEALVLMSWLNAETLATQYQRDLKFIQRGLLACRNADVPECYFVERYLKQNKDIPFHDGVDYQMRVLLGIVPKLWEPPNIGEGSE